MSLTRYNDQVQAVVPRTDKWIFKITGAKTVSPVIANSAALTSFDAVTQAVIDAHLDSTDEFDASLMCDATGMGTGAFLAVLNYGGQISKLLSVRMTTMSGTDNATVFENAMLEGTFANTLTAAAELSALGNVAARGILTGVDALTSGFIIVEVNYLSK